MNWTWKVIRIDEKWIEYKRKTRVMVQMVYQKIVEGRLNKRNTSDVKDSVDDGINKHGECKYFKNIIMAQLLCLRILSVTILGVNIWIFKTVRLNTDSFWSCFKGHCTFYFQIVLFSFITTSSSYTFHSILFENIIRRPQSIHRRYQIRNFWKFFKPYSSKCAD